MPNQPGAGLPNEHKYTVLPEPSGDAVRDEITRLIWQRRPEILRLTWDGARAHCDALSWGGWDDWRLPSRIELVSLLDLSHTDPSIDPNAFAQTVGEWYWTKSPQAGDPERAWFVDFWFGYPDTDSKTNNFLVRCVRE